MLAYSGWLSLPLPALTFLAYCGIVGGMLLAWRFHSSRVFYCLLVLLLAHQALPVLGSSQPLLSPGAITALRALCVLVPLNYALISLMEERGLALASLAPVGVFLFVQCVIVSVLWRSAESGWTATPHSRHLTAALFPNYILFIFIAALVVLAARFLFTRKAVDSSLLWSLVAFYLCVHSLALSTVSELYMAAAAYVLAVSIIENSYLLAYHDELTLLPSRRAFNDAMLRLRTPYCLAVVDIDHFKRCNDTYGHDVGDQVLKLVAAKLAGVTGGGQAYRCGGEEFTIIFSGKTLADVTGHLERLRLTIQSAEFRTRGQDRRQMPRGPDRRKERPAARRKRKNQSVLHVAEASSPATLSVTVSIGVAASDSEECNPHQVLEIADKALYRAKENGRNRVEVASSKRRPKAKAAGIA